LSACKAEAGGIAVAKTTNDNAADGKIGSAALRFMSLKEIKLNDFFGNET